MPPIERRDTRAAAVRLEDRAAGQVPLIVGYAAVYYDPSDPGTEYRLYGDLYERIMPGAFDRAIREDDVRALFNHDDNKVLGRKAAGTLRLFSDKKGLRYEIDPPDTQTARELVESLRRGDISGSSFSFRPKTNVIREEPARDVIERHEVELFDVGPVTFPAYPSTAAAARAKAAVDAHRAGPRPWVAARARAVAVALATA